MRGTQISHHFHLTHSAAARACPCPSSARRPGYHIIAGSEVNGSGRCFILARSLAFIRGGFAWMDGPPARSCCRLAPVLWMASPLLPPPHSEPRIITLLEVTPSSASAHCGDTPKMRGAPRHIPFTGAITKAASRFIALSAVSPVRRGHLSPRMSGYRSLIYYRNIINGLRN